VIQKRMLAQFLLIVSYMADVGTSSQALVETFGLKNGAFILYMELKCFVIYFFHVIHLSIKQGEEEGINERILFLSNIATGVPFQDHLMDHPSSPYYYYERHLLYILILADIIFQDDLIVG
ncbi:hypothetical protein ACJX0J_006063, partial [Zea mays]